MNRGSNLIGFLKKSKSFFIFLKFYLTESFQVGKKMPGGGLPGVGRFTMGGKHNESWFKHNRLSKKKQVFFLFFIKNFI